MFNFTDLLTLFISLFCLTSGSICSFTPCYPVFIEHNSSLTYRKLLVIPLMFSVILILLFYFSSVLNLIFFVPMIFTSLFSVKFCTSFWLSSLFNCVNLKLKRFLYYFSYCVGFAITMCWILTGHWFWINCIGMCLATMCIGLLKLPNLKMCSILLVSLLIYDVFWVFLSSSFFSENVMLHVATTHFENPISNLLHKISLHTQDLPRLQIPGTLFIPDPSAWNFNQAQPFNKASPTSSHIITSKLSPPSLTEEFALVTQKLLSDNSYLKHASSDNRRILPSTRENGASLINYSIFGLGDIVMPGLLIAMLLRFDWHNYFRNQFKSSCLDEEDAEDLNAMLLDESTNSVHDPEDQSYSKLLSFSDLATTPKSSTSSTSTISRCFYGPSGYLRISQFFLTAAAGYSIGLLVASFCSEYFKAPQPALLYLVPATLIPTYLKAYWHGDFWRLWTGNFEIDLVIPIGSAVAETSHKNHPHQSTQAKSIPVENRYYV